MIYKELERLLKEKFNDVELYKYIDPEYEIEYDPETDFIGVGPFSRPVGRFNDWDAAARLANKRPYETFICINETGQGFMPYAVMNRGKYKKQPVKACRLRKKHPNECN